MEKTICQALQRIELYGNIKDIEFVNITIGQYRLEAEKYWGFVKRFIHYQATEIELELKKILHLDKK